MKAVCVYCGSAPGDSPDYAAAAVALAREIAGRGLDLIYGGAHKGLMGEIADAALAAGGRVVGVIPQALLDREVAHENLSELIVVSSMHERKALMAQRADAFVALPGGFGTLEELVETLTWGQLGMHEKPCALMNVRGYYDPLLGFFDAAVQEGFLRRAHRDMLIVESEPARLLERCTEYRAPSVSKWRR